MKSLIDKYKETINTIYILSQKVITQLDDEWLTSSDRAFISQLNTDYISFERHTVQFPNDATTIINAARALAVNIYGFALRIANENNHAAEATLAANELIQASKTLVEQIDSGPFYRPRDEYLQNPESSDNEKNSVSSYEKQIIEIKAKLQSEIETFERDISKGSNEIESLKLKSYAEYKKSNEEISELLNKVEQIKSAMSGLNEDIAKELKKAAKITEDALKSSKHSNDHIGELLGQTASKVLLVDYANTADTEKESANKMRKWSLICMTLTGVILCISLYESLVNTVEWQQSIFRIFAAIALSVPAAYLARESAKHRNQEHINRRISLDLRAITPYIASLPPEEQNKIKSDVAAKIFGAQDNGNSSTDNFPINIQELAKLIIEKIPTQK